MMGPWYAKKSKAVSDSSYSGIKPMDNLLFADRLYSRRVVFILLDDGGMDFSLFRIISFQVFFILFFVFKILILGIGLYS